MAGESDLNKLLGSMSPKLNSKEFIFCSVKGNLEDYLSLKPLATFLENEGLTLIIEKQQADSAKINYQLTYQQITLSVHSSLEAVGLTAAFATKLAENNLSANVVAGYYHDHLFVQTEVAEQALAALQELQQANG